MRSPICKVGSIEPEGMKTVWTTKARSRTATRRAITTTTSASLIHRAGWGSSGGGAGEVSTPGGATEDGLDTVDEDPHDTVRAGVEPGGVTGQVVHEPCRFGSDRLGVEDDEI